MGYIQRFLELSNVSLMFGNKMGNRHRVMGSMANTPIILFYWLIVNVILILLKIPLCIKILITVAHTVGWHDSNSD